jgi:hypothetical protein
MALLSKKAAALPDISKYVIPRIPRSKHGFDKSIFSMLQVPREIRDQIYLSVLAPTGYMYLSPTHLFDPQSRFKARPCTADGAWTGVELKLSLLRTCKQVFNETKALLFKHNTIIVSDSATYFKFTRFPYYRLQQVQISVNFDSWGLRNYFDLFGTFVSIEYPIYPINRLSRSAHLSCFFAQDLKSIILRPEANFQRFMEGIKKEFEDDGVWPLIPGSIITSQLSCFVRRLVSATQWTHMGKAKRSINLNLSLAPFLPHTALPTEKEIECLEKLERVVRDVHTAFGGTLYNTGKLKYRDGECLRTVFDIEKLVSLRRGEIEKKEREEEEKSRVEMERLKVEEIVVGMMALSLDA